MGDIAAWKHAEPETRRVFLMDGDALVLDNERLIPILESLEQAFPLLTRISSYANGFNITRRSDEELLALARHKLSLLYVGLESGSQTILNRCQKKSSAEEMIAAVQRAHRCKIKSSVMVLLGLGGKEHSRLHVEETINALNQMQPAYLSFLTLMVVPGTPLYKDVRRGMFQELSPEDHLKELFDILSGVDLRRTIVRANHASNYLPIEGRFPQDKAKVLELLTMALGGKIRLKSELMRGL
jgi:radical SAM superfamily enzyme YgiQ (UPF0313 family)